MSVSGYKAHTSQLAALGQKLGGKHTGSHAGVPVGVPSRLPLTPTSAVDQHLWSRTCSACLNKVSLPELP